MILFTKGAEITILCQSKISMKFSINLKLKPFRFLNCLHMIFLHCILRYLIILQVDAVMVPKPESKLINP